MGIKSYNNINEILSDLDKKLSEINKGTLSLQGLDECLGLSRELYERLVVVRHKARELAVTPEKKKVENEYSAPVEKPVARKELIAKTEEPEQKEQPLFDFTMSEPLSESDATPVAVIEDNVPTVKRVPRATKSVPAADSEPSLNDSIGTDDSVSLRKKLQSTPVKDLTKEIGIGKKFEYISLMFKGDGKAYAEAIEALNSCNGLDGAREKINAFSVSHEWNLEDKTVAKFIELVERRYL